MKSMAAEDGSYAKFAEFAMQWHHEIAHHMRLFFVRWTN